MKNLETIAQRVWATSDVSEKQNILMEMVESFQHKNKADTFAQAVSNCASPSRLDQMAANLALNNTDPVIK